MSQHPFWLSHSAWYLRVPVEGCIAQKSLQAKATRHPEPCREPRTNSLAQTPQPDQDAVLDPSNFAACLPRMFWTPEGCRELRPGRRAGVGNSAAQKGQSVFSPDIQAVGREGLGAGEPSTDSLACPDLGAVFRRPPNWFWYEKEKRLFLWNRRDTVSLQPSLMEAALETNARSPRRGQPASGHLQIAVLQSNT